MGLLPAPDPEDFALLGASRPMDTQHRSTPAFGLLLVLLASPLATSAQPALSVSAGAASYDLSGVGTSGVAAVRGEWPLASGLALQAGSSFFWYGTQGDEDVAMLLPEVGVLLRPSASFPGYLGLGAGHTLGVKGSLEEDLTLYGALGLDIEDRGGWAVRPEVRIRVVDPWVGTIGEFTLGVRRRFD